MYSVHVISYWGFSLLVPSGSIFSPCLDFFTMDCRQVLMDRGSDFIALLRACTTFVFKWIILMQVEGLGQVPSCCNFYYGMKKIHISLLSLYSISCKQGLNSSEYSRNIEKTKPSGVLVIKTNACESHKWIWFEWISKGASKKSIIQSPSQGPISSSLKKSTLDGTGHVTPCDKTFSIGKEKIFEKIYWAYWSISLWFEFKPCVSKLVVASTSHTFTFKTMFLFTIM